MIARDTLVFHSLSTIARQRDEYDEPRSRAVLELLATADALHAHLRSRLNELSLSESQFSALVVLRKFDPDPVLPAALASHTRSSRTKITAVLERLHRGGLITRKRSCEDRRNYLITLTDEGRAIADRAEASVLKSWADLSGPLIPESVRSVVLTLCKQLAPGRPGGAAGTPVDFP